jgi:hypothetical protein
MEKTIFVGLVLGILATIAMATTGAISTTFADKGGDPNNSEQATQNAEKRDIKKLEKQQKALGDDNPHNDNGPTQAHDNLHDEHGVQPIPN